MKSCENFEIFQIPHKCINEKFLISPVYTLLMNLTFSDSRAMLAIIPQKSRELVFVLRNVVLRNWAQHPDAWDV